MFRKDIVKRAVLRRFAVTLHGTEQTFAGLLAEFDNDVYVFANCNTVPMREGETSVNVPGRLYVDRSNVLYLQELP